MGTLPPGLDGEDVSQLLARFGSPLYVVDISRVEAAARRLRSALPAPAFSLLYSIKANPSLPVLTRLREIGFGCDACSVTDLELARRAGWRPEQCSLTGVGLSKEELKLAIDSGVWVNLDSLTELRRWAALAPGRPVGLRLNTKIEAGFHPHCRSGRSSSKVGIRLDELDEAQAIARAAGVAITALHSHIGSGLTEATPLIESARILLEVARRMPQVNVVNIGGGLGAPYDPEDLDFPIELLATGLAALGDDFRATGRALTIVLEPGELLVAAAGSLLCTVRVVKRQACEPHVVIVDATANLLPAVLLYETFYPLAVTWTEAAAERWDVYGRTNQGGELLAASRLLPPLHEDDVLVFGNTGAYAACRASQFNELPRPAELVFDQGQVRLAKRAELVEDLLRPHASLPDITAQ